MWYARDPKRSIKFEDNRIHFAAVCSPAFIYDLETGVKRPATLKDFENIVRLVDYLERLDEGYGAVHVQDIPDAAVHAYSVLMQFKYSSKPVRGRARGATLARDCSNMAAIVAGGEEELMKKPMLLSMINPTSPLQWDGTMIEGMMEYVKRNQLVVPSPEIMAGATGPVTLAGTIVQHNAEVLSMITLMQLVNPGIPSIYGNVSTAIDMRTAMTRLGAPELGILHVAIAQLAKHYNLPTRGAAGNTDSKALDIQAGYETAFNLVLAALAGINLITYAVGGVDFSASVSYEKIVTDHDLLGMVERLVKGIEISEETLAIDVINSVGPGGHFLAQKHTRKYFKKERFIPTLFDTQPYDSWLKSDLKDIKERARKEVKRILREHKPLGLDKDIKKELEEYAKKVMKRSTR